jgi:hypothetical protein
MFFHSDKEQRMCRKKQSNRLCIANDTTQGLRSEGNMHSVCVARGIVCVAEGFESSLGDYGLCTGRGCIQIDKRWKMCMHEWIRSGFEKESTCS